MLRVMTIVGTRPEIIRLSCIIEKLDRYTDHTLVHSGQNYDYELNEVFFKELGIRAPDVFLGAGAAGQTPAQTIGQVIIAADEVLDRLKPEALLILGDTNSALAAIAAKRRKIPIFHMEAGNRCFDFRVPEEINRRIVDHISDINLTYSQIAREYLLREGFPPDRLIRSGSPLREVILRHKSAIEESRILQTLKLEPQRYFLVSSHREENVDDEQNLRRLFGVMQTLLDQYGLPVIVSTHPRTRARIEALQITADPRIQFHKPFGFIDYVHLQASAKAVLSDSGTITEESSILNFPAVNLREVHERPEGVEEAAVMFVGLDADRTLDALRVLEDQPRGDNRLLRLTADYEPENVSDKILRIIISYTDYVNRKVWSR